MQLSPDFFSYFEAAAPVLDADESLMCVSSWNDHGQASWDLGMSAASTDLGSLLPDTCSRLRACSPAQWRLE